MAISVSGNRPRPILERRAAHFKPIAPKIPNPQNNEVLRVFAAVYTALRRGC